MVYNFKEYKAIFDTPMKRSQELAISTKIMDLLNKNKYESLEEFIGKNPNYQIFLQNNNMENVVKHFGNTLIEEDYTRILENLRVLTKTKQDFEEENIKTTNIDDKEYSRFKGEDRPYFIDNSDKNKSVEEQMKNMQGESESFQTSDIRKNTENMFKELESRDDGFNLRYLSEINRDTLNNEEKELYGIALLYQQDKNEPIRVDLNKGIIVDKDNNISKIQKENEEFSIIGDENTKENENVQEKAYQKQMVLTPSKDTLYSN